MKEHVNVILIHGAGYSHTTFSVVEKQLSRYNVLNVDLPGHGDNAADDYSIGCFKAYIDQIIKGLDIERTVIVGHSLGGSIATFYPKAMAVIMIDITEEPALRSLDTIPFLLARRPTSFNNLDEAVAWYVRMSPHCKNPIDSMKGQLRTNGEHDGSLTWRVNLLQCKDHWRQWFVGMDDRFQSCQNPLLILSDRELLDKKLMIASMQGRFQLQIVPGCGHAIQEDQPDILSKIIMGHIERILKLQHTLHSTSNRLV